jgi:hypothetical protein
MTQVTSTRSIVCTEGVYFPVDTIFMYQTHAYRFGHRLLPLSHLIPDMIITGPNTSKIDNTIQEIATKFDITHEEMVSDFLGIKIQ